MSEDPGVQAPSAHAERVLLWDHWEQWNPPADLQAAGGDKFILKLPLIAMHKSMPDQSAQYVLESIQKVTISFMWPFWNEKECEFDQPSFLVTLSFAKDDKKLLSSKVN